MATPRLGLVVEDKPTELSCTIIVMYLYRGSTLCEQAYHDVSYISCGARYVILQWRKL